MLCTALFLLASSIATKVSANGIPPDAALNADTFEEFSRLLNHKNEPDFHLEISRPILADAFEGKPGFYHGVASGDPLPDKVIVWTRYTPEREDDSIPLELRMAAVDPSLDFDAHLDPERNHDLKMTKVLVDASSDFVAKIDVTGLKSNTHYVFAFVAIDDDGSTVLSSSQVGQTRTAPAFDDDVEELTYAFFSCSHFSNGYFHPYDVASTIKDLDLWVHVGDYIYEYGSYGSYASSLTNRRDMTLPVWEIVDLQDYRNRYATYHLDEGLQNLRRRAPMMSTWDDHETTNNSYGQGEVSNTGAENHQDTCPVNRTSTAEEKDSAGCDRDEGNIKIRLTNAAQAYMEWLPLRRGPGSMGVVDLTSITQVVEWGKLATFVSVDTRITDRSAEPTLGSAFNPFAGYAYGQTNMSSYYDPNSEVAQTFAFIGADIMESNANPEFTMVGEDNSDFIMDVFADSKAANKTWQIFAAATMMGPHVGPNMDKWSELVDSSIAPTIQGYTDAVLTSPGSFVLRALVAMAITKTPWNTDGFDGFAHERAELIEGFAEHANNPIILGGDLHDSWAWTLYEKGNMDGTPRAVNLGAPGVTSPGWGGFLGGVVEPIEGLLGGADGAYKLIADSFIAENPGLKYADVYKKGFVAVKATKTTHTAEYYLIEPADMLSDFDEVRSASGLITSNFNCGASLVTQAGSPGSLDKQDECIIEFDSTRPAVWDLPVPEAEDVSGGSLLSGCGYDACEFDASSSGSAKTYKIMTAEGCLTADGLESGRGIKTKPCMGSKRSQEWHVSADGHVMSSVDSNWCFAKLGQRLVVDMCDVAPTFGYNAFDKSMYLLSDPSKVVSTGFQSNKRVKIVAKTGELSEHIEIH